MIERLQALWLVVLTLSVGAQSFAAQPGGDDPLLDAMAAEVERAMVELRQALPPAYFIAVEVTDSDRVRLVAEDGGLQGYAPQRYRRLDVDVRVGSPELDSSHPLRSGKQGRQIGGRWLPLTDRQDVLRRVIWREIDNRFAAAQERWARVQSEQQTLVREERIEDLAPVSPVSSTLETEKLELDLSAWEDRLRNASALLTSSRVTHDPSVRLWASVDNRRLVSSEGTRIRHGEARYRVVVSVDTVADDGEALALQHTWEARATADLPEPAALSARVRELEQLLRALRAAPEQEPYSGPAALSGRAAAVFFHEILGHRLEGHRLKQIDDAQTFRSLLGKRILPPGFAVVDDPTRARFGHQVLFGHYRYDNQGVAARRTPLVRDGVLVGFLESRSPSTRGVQSNGHGRRHSGFDAVSRQGNFFVEASRTVTASQLRQRLIALAREAGLAYGLWIDEIQGGFTFTGRTIPNAFNVRVLVAKRIYTDGRPDELVRGIDFIGTPLVTFSRIVAAADDYEVFNGFCGAESGSVPVSAIAPTLLISQIETQRKAKRQNTPPLLPPPGRRDADQTGRGAIPSIGRERLLGPDLADRGSASEANEETDR